MTTAETVNSEDVPTVPEATETEAAENDGSGREAAKYRRALRTVEADRDDLAAKLDATRRALVERDLGNLEPAVFWALHPDVADLVDEAGRIDPNKLVAAGQEVFATLGLPGQFSNVRKGAIGPYVPGEGAAPSGEVVRSNPRTLRATRHSNHGSYWPGRIGVDRGSRASGPPKVTVAPEGQRRRPVAAPINQLIRAPLCASQEGQSWLLQPL